MNQKFLLRIILFEFKFDLCLQMYIGIYNNTCTRFARHIPITHIRLILILLHRFREYIVNIIFTEFGLRTYPYSYTIRPVRFDFSLVFQLQICTLYISMYCYSRGCESHDRLDRFSTPVHRPTSSTRAQTEYSAGQLIQ